MSNLTLKINISKTREDLGLKVELNTKFKNDTCHFENEYFLIVLDGIILNKNDFFEGDKSSWELCLISLYKEKGDAFYEQFRGSFFGIIFDKKAKKWIVFQDHIGSKNMYFSVIKNDSYIFSNQITEIYKIRKALGIKEELDINAAYMLLSYGYMLDNYTLSKGIKKMLPGSYAKIENGFLSNHTYFKLNNKENNELSEDEIIEETVNQENIIKSPMVGVAYLSADPNSSPYVKVGQHVKQGDTLLLIEAMKTFNEIKAPKSGVIKKIVVLNSQPVEFGDVLLIFE